ncbi:hypothetical protein [Mesorhizobium japonicum]|uniref:Mll0446 protein n=1 Tax=Mesorhizobium japonicum (strain LMG 29417 / CECT 9101 / MAFF 303099) TaxID=266835 RepID=Q98MT5_RHILO|nr:hypothetical protein [Mesorhizobium japonicum]BAB48028.1 mll0446 [Mesorhizobium japonicum MAFF 303099]
MAQLVPVDTDPFATTPAAAAPVAVPAQASPALVPVDHDPFAGTNQPPGVPVYVPPGVKGYDPQTGEVAPGQYTTGNDLGLAFTSSVLNGVPIVGPYLKQGAESLGAKVNSALSGKSEADVRYASDQATNRAVNDNPYTAGSGNIVGAVAGTLPAVVAAPELFGAGEAGLGMRSVVSALTGGTINAADSGVRSGGDPAAMERRGLIGAGFGLIAPGGGTLIGKGIGSAVDYLTRPGASELGNFSRATLAKITGAMNADGLTPQAVQQRLTRLGPDAMLADAGPNLQQTAAGLVAKPGEARGIIQDAIAQRDAGANQRIRSTLDSELGPAPVPSQINAGITANQAALSPEYRVALQNAGPVDTLPIARYLDQDIQTLRGEPQRVLQRVRAMLDHVPTPQEIAQARALGQPPPGNSLVTDAGELLNARHAVDDMLQTTQGSNALNALSTARQAIDDELRASVPGIKEVDAKYSELARQRDAVQRGQTVLSSGRESPRPAELAQEVQQGAQPQGMQVGPSAVPVRLREGARAEIERIVGTNLNDRVALQGLIKGQGDWNPQRLATLFGQDKAQRLLDVLDAERTFANTSNFVTKNSATAARLQAVKSLDGGDVPGLGMVDSYKAGGLLGLGRAGALKGLGPVVEAIRSKGANAANSALARGLVSGDHDAVVKALIAASPVPIPTKAISKVAEALLLGSGSAAMRP